MQLPQLLSQPPGHDSPIFAGRGASTLLFSLDQEGIFRFVSASSEQLLKYPCEHLIGGKITEHLSNHPWNANWRGFPNASQVSRDVQVINCELIDREKATVPLEVCRYFAFEKDLPIGLVGMARRISSASDILRTQSHLSNPSLTGPSLLSRWESLSPGELEVIELVVQGHMNKTVAKRMRVSVRSIEARRSKAMKKLGVRSVSDLVKLRLLVDQHRQNLELTQQPDRNQNYPPSTPTEQKVAENHNEPEA